MFKNFQQKKFTMELQNKTKLTLGITVYPPFCTYFNNDAHQEKGFCR